MVFSYGKPTCPGSFQRLHVLQKSAPPATSPKPGMLEDSMETMVSILNIPQLRGKYGLNDDKFHRTP